MSKNKRYKNLIRKIGQQWKKIVVLFLGIFFFGWLISSLIVNGKLTFPMISVEQWLGQDKSVPFISLEDGGIKIGTNTVKISRFRLDMGNLKIVNMANPTLAQDAATKAYVDAAGSLPAAWTCVVRSAGSSNDRHAVVACVAPEKIIVGGCQPGDYSTVLYEHPSDQGWYCWNSDYSYNHRAYANCCK